MSTGIFDCVSYLHEALLRYQGGEPLAQFSSDSLLAACVQAEATLHAGKLAAHVATTASIATLAAGGLAFIAGVATLVPFLSDRRHKRVSQARHLLGLIQEAQVPLSSFRNALQTAFGAFDDTVRPRFYISLNPLSLRFSDLSWMEESPLPTECLISIREAVGKLEHLHYLAAMLAEETVDSDPKLRKAHWSDGSHFCVIVQGYDNAIVALRRADSEICRVMDGAIFHWARNWLGMFKSRFPARREHGL